jgi:K+-sensing histidine kinase KdpD
MQGEVLRLQRLIDDLFSLAQVDAVLPALELLPSEASPLIQRMVDAVAQLAWQSGHVQVSAQLPEELPAALVDPARLEQVLANLLRNAVRHTPPGAIVAVSVGIVLTVVGMFIVNAEWGHLYPWALPGLIANDFSRGAAIPVARVLFGSLGRVLAAFVGG